MYPYILDGYSVSIVVTVSNSSVILTLSMTFYLVELILASLTQHSPIALMSLEASNILSPVSVEQRIARLSGGQVLSMDAKQRSKP